MNLVFADVAGGHQIHDREPQAQLVWAGAHRRAVYAQLAELSFVLLKPDHFQSL